MNEWQTIAFLLLLLLIIDGYTCSLLNYHCFILITYSVLFTAVLLNSFSTLIFPSSIKQLSNLSWTYITFHSLHIMSNILYWVNNYFK